LRKDVKMLPKIDQSKVSMTRCFGGQEKSWSQHDKSLKGEIINIGIFGTLPARLYKYKNKEENKMVKSKRLSRGSLAVLLLALLLALSMVVGITGAWFTDAAANKGTTPVNFGKVDIEVGGVVNKSGTGYSNGWLALGTGDKVVPGSSWEGSITLTNVGDQDLYFGVLDVAAELYAESDIENGAPKSSATAITLPSGMLTVELKDGATAVAAMNADYQAAEELTVATATKVYTVKVTVDKNLPNNDENNTYAGVNYIAFFKIGFGAVQKANIEGDGSHSAAQVAGHIIYNSGNGPLQYVAAA